MSDSEKKGSDSRHFLLEQMTVANLRKPLQNTAVKPSEIEQKQMTVGHLAKPLNSGPKGSDKK